jgi:hypothetical protein
MKRPKGVGKGDAPGLLQKLSADESAAVLHHLLEQHPELQSEAEQLTTKVVSTPSIEDIAEDVHHRVVGIDLDALVDELARILGYVEPAEAAIDLSRRNSRTS